MGSVLPDLKMALERLGGFSFVGLTTRWSLSICLFHLKFDTPCYGFEFFNTRPTSERKTAPVAAPKLPTNPADADHIIYNRVKDIFESDVVKFGATDTRCKQVCGER